MRVLGVVGVLVLLSCGEAAAPVAPKPVVASATVAPPAPPPKRAPVLSSAATFSCVLRSGKVACWGTSDAGATGSTTELDTAKSVAGVTDAIDLATSNTSACIVRESGAVACWGRGSTEPRELPGVTDATRVAVGADHGCYVRTTRGVRCFDAHGAIHDVTELADAAEVVVASDWACARRASGGVACWAFGAWKAASIAELDGVVALSAGQRACAVRARGTVACFDPKKGDAPADVEGLADAHAISADAKCAVLTNGSVLCKDDKGTPREIVASGVIAVATGTDFACALHEDSGVSCWGRRDGGALGDGKRAWFATPTEVAGIDDAVEIAMEMPEQCVRRKSGKVTCWGRGTGGKPVDVAAPDVTSLVTGFTTCAERKSGPAGCLGRGSGFDPIPGGGEHVAPRGVPRLALAHGRPYYFDADGKTTHVPGIADATFVYANYRHACVVRKSGAVFCWDVDDEFLPGKPLKATPKRVAGIDDAVSLSGYGAPCAIRKNGEVACVSDMKAKPYPLPARAVSGTAAGMGRCFVLRDGRLFCNAILQGRRPPSHATLAGPLPSFENVVSAALYDDRLCAVLSSGKVSCIGATDGGTFLGADAGSSATPVDVVGL